MHKLNLCQPPTPPHTHTHLTPLPPKNYEGGISFAKLSVFYPADVLPRLQADELCDMEGSTIWC